MPRYKDATKINPPTVGDQLLASTLEAEPAIRIAIEEPVIKSGRKSDMAEMKEDIAYLREEIIKIHKSMKELVDCLEKMQSYGLKMRPNTW